MARTQRDHRWTALARKYRDYCRARNSMCWLCIQRGDYENAGIDYNAPPQSAHAFEPDHYHPWDTHPHLRYQWANLRPAHSRCNRQRGKQTIETATLQPCTWVKPDW